MRDEAKAIAEIVLAETGEFIEQGDRPEEYYPKLFRAMDQMRQELLEYRGREKVEQRISELEDRPTICRNLDEE